MDLLFDIKYPEKISPLLTLTKILISPDEPIYITKMRNLILFQISGADYQYLEYKFKHDFTFVPGKGSLLFRCFYRAFSNVTKFQVLVHNLEPFRYWRANTIDESGHRVAFNCDRNEVEFFEDEIMPRDRFLVATINYLFSDTSLEYWNYRSLSYIIKVPLSRREACSKTVLNPVHESTWRRLYDANDTLFNCEKSDFDLYEREQTMNLRPVSVFREIKKREIGCSFKKLEVLKTIASPYYYVLPHQNEKEYAEFETDSSSFCARSLSGCIEFQFLSRLQIARKNISQK
ncbi:uncharacterized protein TNIN_167601 [Trichonephila inaurata madagascariensis]|uniref:Uncharacterized protein n=1 Tax=Trichonephila inaurata madagascariensis TaxID=2747483 RepID=A0A8X6JFN5_9ARAC|nr:uncharacterized protein TNIN_167601 [Trichonephila inaurata madagascariensis]